MTAAPLAPADADRGGGRMNTRILNDDVRVRPRPDVMGCQLGEGLALLDMRSGTYFQLNEVGAFVWNALDGRSVADIADGVAREYAIPAAGIADVTEDVRAVVRDMLENDLVVATDAAAA